MMRNEEKSVRTIRVCEHELSPDFRHIYIVPLMDLHIGEAKYGRHLFAEALFDGYISWILEKPNAFTILNGDLIAAPSRGGRSYEIWNQFLSPQQQLDYLAEKIRPLKDRILGITAGNHENRIYAQTGLEPMLSLCDKLGLSPKIYGRDGILIKLWFGLGKRRAMPFIIYATHGWGGARKTGGQVNKVEELGILVHANVYITGHEHTLFMSRNEYLTPNRKGAAHAFRKVFVGCGCFCDYTPFLQTIGRRHPDLGAPRIRLEFKKRRGGYLAQDIHISI